MENKNSMEKIDYEKEKEQLLEIIKQNISEDILKRIEIANTTLETSEEIFDITISHEGAQNANSR